MNGTAPDQSGLGAPGDIPPEVIAEALHSVLASPDFAASPSLSSFLRFVVEETIAGRGHALKGYSIATVALGRSPDFDPQSDPIVRVQAGRLRKALAHFYATAGANEPIQIRLVRGSYQVSFEDRRRSRIDHRLTSASDGATPSSLPAEGAPADGDAGAAVGGIERFRADDRPAAVVRRGSPRWLPVVLIALSVGVAALAVMWLRAPPARTPVADLSTLPQVIVHNVDWQITRTPNDQELDLLAPRLRAALSRFDDLFIVPATASANSATDHGVRYDIFLDVIGGRNGQRVLARLEHRATGLIVWSMESGALPVGSAGQAERDALLRYLATTLAQPYGVIFSHLRGVVRDARPGMPFTCIVESFDYWRTYSRQDYDSARRCIDAAIAASPGIAGLHAQGTYILLEAYRNRYGGDDGALLDAALAAAQRAVALAPGSARAQQALLAVEFARREFPRAWQAAERALALNPFDTDIMADIGARHIQLGDHARGLALINEAIKANPAPPAWVMTFKALGHVAAGERDMAASVIRQTVDSQFPLAMIGRVLEAQYSDNIAAIGPRLDALRRLHPDIERDMGGYMDRLVIVGDLRDRLLAAINEARTAAGR